MVDAIGPVNTNNDITINWRKLTAKEVINRADKGENVPPDVLKWAEDYIKLTNAPDNVTYDAVGGSTRADAIAGVDEVPEGTEGVEDGEDVENPDETEDPDGEKPKEEDPVELTAAQQERQNLSDNGVSLYSQGKIFVRHSQD